MKAEYLAVLAAMLSVPLLVSFSKRLNMYGSRSPGLLLAILAPSLLFGVWDMIATERRHWWFNPDYVLGIELAGLPLEEWLFFPVLAFVSVFTWEAINELLRRRP